MSALKLPEDLKIFHLMNLMQMHIKLPVQNII